MEFMVADKGKLGICIDSRSIFALCCWRIGRIGRGGCRWLHVADCYLDVMQAFYKQVLVKGRHMCREFVSITLRSQES